MCPWLRPMAAKRIRVGRAVVSGGAAAVLRAALHAAPASKDDFHRNARRSFMRPPSSWGDREGPLQKLRLRWPLALPPNPPAPPPPRYARRRRRAPRQPYPLRYDPAQIARPSTGPPGRNHGEALDRG